MDHSTRNMTRYLTCNGLAIKTLLYRDLTLLNCFAEHKMIESFYQNEIKYRGTETWREMTLIIKNGLTWQELNKF